MSARGLFSLYIYTENFKNLLDRNRWTDFNITWKTCFFDNHVPRLIDQIWFVKNTAAGTGLIFPIYLYRKLQKFSCHKSLDRIQYNMAELFFWWPSIENDQTIVVHQKARRGLFSQYIYTENFQNLFVWNHSNSFCIIWQKCSFVDPLSRLFKPS